MGQTSSNSASQDAEEARRSHYELLDIPSTATEDEIKKAYRRRALELHPDRNFGKEEAATALFAEVQAAYSVLSDPQERAWYDAHQAEFLSGGVGSGDGEAHFERSVKVTTAEDIRAMCASRNSAFSDFSDGPNGFFTKVRELFERLALEEGIASTSGGWEPVDFPSFGSSEDEFQDVVKSFYSVWGGFSTAKTFAWRDKYRPSADYDRRTRRAMEKENQKERDEAMKEFNEAVRALVLFVRRRDPRYVATATTDAERQKALRDAAAAQAARSRKVNAEKLTGQAIPDWAQSRNDEEADDYATDDEDEDEEEGEDEEPQVWECVVCSKTFKSEGQYDAHERSKKHKQAVFKLKRTMRDEDIELGLDPEKKVSEHSNLGADESDVESIEQLSREAESNTFMENNTTKQEAPVEEKSVPDASLDTKIDTQATNLPADSTDFPRNDPIYRNNHTDSTEEDSDEGDDTYAPRSAIESRILGVAPVEEISKISLSTNPSPYDTQDESVYTPDTGTTTPSQQPGPKKGKAKEKRARRAAKEVAASITSNGAGAGSNANVADLECVACGNTFGSKNKLFEHIKSTGHARPTGEDGSASIKLQRRKKR